jgi:preprotein translocase subunit SecB
MSSPVQFNNYRILKIDFRSNEMDPDKPVDGHIPDPEVEIRVNPENKNEFLVKLISRIVPDQDQKKNNCPLELEMEIMGFFELIGELEEEERRFHIGISAPSMLYGVVRTWVSQITAHSGFSALMLPSFQFGGGVSAPEKD